MTALENYKKVLNEFVALNEQIVELSKRKRIKQRELSIALGELLRERGWLSSILWTYQRFEGDYMVIQAAADNITNQVLYFLDSPNNTEYHLGWSDDHDYVTHSLVIRTIGDRSEVFLEIHRDHIDIAKDLSINIHGLIEEHNRIAYQLESTRDLIENLV